MDLLITVENEPSEKDNNFICNKLQEFNDNYTGVKAIHFSVFAKDHNEIQGGAICYLDENSIYVDMIWVNETCRQSGIGSKILKLAEEEGRKRGAIFSTLDTFDFQAEGFYQKFGYERIGVIPAYLGEYDRIFLRKKL